VVRLTIVSVPVLVRPGVVIPVVPSRTMLMVMLL